MHVEKLHFPAGDSILNIPALPALAYAGALSGDVKQTVESGHAVLALGGPQVEEVEVSAGDALVLPAGTGHKRVSSSDDFQAVGAYPPGQQDYDLLRGDPAELEQALANIEQVELPRTGPVAGDDGPLLEAWGS